MRIERDDRTEQYTYADLNELATEPPLSWQAKV